MNKKLRKEEIKHYLWGDSCDGWIFVDTDGHIARIESGKSNITVSTLSDICKYFEISLSDFFSTIESN